MIPDADGRRRTGSSVPRVGGGDPNLNVVVCCGKGVPRVGGGDPACNVLCA